MSILDAIFRRRVTPDIRVRSEEIASETANIDGKEVIAVDPEPNQSRSQNRPPIIFESGII